MKLFKELDLSRLEFWPPELVAASQSILAKYHNVFSLEPSELGCTHSTKHVIKITDDNPFKEWFRWIPLPLVEEDHIHLQEMLDSGMIHPSQSAWCNPVVLVWKKDGDPCFCIDFWHLNICTKKDSYPLPRIQEALQSCVGDGYFSCLDLKSGFCQIKMDESCKQYTAFSIGKLGIFEWKCMPFGLCNTPATFQHLMQNCLGELNLIYCLICLDDIVIFSHTAWEHPPCLHVVFDWFSEHSLKLKPLKCNLFWEEITYLAHWVSKDGVQPSNSNLMAIAECALAQTYTEGHAFLGLVGHYRRFIKGFACIALPLNNNLTVEGASRKSECVSLSEEALKQACKTTPVLAFADYTKPFLLETDPPRMDSGQCCPRNRQMDNITWLHMVAEPLPLMRIITIQLSLSSWHWNGQLQTFHGVPALSTLPGKDR